MKREYLTIDISLQSLLRIIAVIFMVWFVITIRDIFLLLFVVAILVSALSPIVDAWSVKMPRVIALSAIFLIIIGILAAAISMILPPLVSQVESLAITIQSWSNGGFSLPFSQKIVDVIANQINNIGSTLSSGIFETTASVISGIVAFITILTLTFYLLSEQEGTKKFMLEYLPLDHKDKIIDTINKIGDKLGAWVRGQLSLMLLIGVIDGVSLAILGVPFALALGLWAGLTEAIPYVGPFLGLIPAAIVAFVATGGWLVPLLVIAVFALVQQLEANIFVPKIMSKAVGLSPVIIIIAILIGGKLFGLLGIVLAVPAAAVVSVILKEWQNLKW